MGWRETLGGAGSGSNPLPRTPQNTQNPPRAREPEPEPVGFGGSGGFGYQGENSNSPQADPNKEISKNGERADPFEPNTPTQYPQNTQNPKPQPSHPLEGLGLLREDWQFIERRARGRHREALLRGYAEHWRAAAAAEPMEFRKANAGRRAANAWLREAGR
jgi:hypothetical protein